MLLPMQPRAQRCIKLQQNPNTGPFLLSTACKCGQQKQRQQQQQQRFLSHSTRAYVIWNQVRNRVTDCDHPVCMGMQRITLIEGRERNLIFVVLTTLWTIAGQR